MTTRVIGWQRQLNIFILDAQKRYKSEGFVPGKFDCVHFVADWLKVLTGFDHLGDYRGAYETEAEGFALLAEREGSLLEALKSRFGQPVPPSFAQRGDVAYKHFPEGEACGIVFTSGSTMRALFLADRGFAMHRARDMDHVFSVR